MIIILIIRQERNRFFVVVVRDALFSSESLGDRYENRVGGWLRHAPPYSISVGPTDNGPCRVVVDCWIGGDRTLVWTTTSRCDTVLVRSFMDGMGVVDGMGYIGGGY